MSGTDPLGTMASSARSFAKEIVMPDRKRFERGPAEGSRSTTEKQLEQRSAPEHSEDKAGPQESFPPFDDPANSPAPAGPAAKPTARPSTAPSEDPIFAGHPDFSQDAASNKPPKDGMGLTRPLGETSEETGQSGAQGPSITSPPEKISKDDVDHRPL
jgi:hypothetical protein